MKTTQNTPYYIIQVFDISVGWCLHCLCGNDVDRALTILEREKEKYPELVLELGTCKRQWWNEKGWD